MNTLLTLTLLCPVAAPVPKPTEITDAQLHGLWRAKKTFGNGVTEGYWYYFADDGTYQMGWITRTEYENGTVTYRLQHKHQFGTWHMRNNRLVMTEYFDEKKPYGVFEGTLKPTSTGYKTSLDFRRVSDDPESAWYYAGVEWIRDPNMPNFGEEK